MRRVPKQERCSIFDRARYKKAQTKEHSAEVWRVQQLMGRDAHFRGNVERDDRGSIAKSGERVITKPQF
jgi:hypothetical protein